MTHSLQSVIVLDALAARHLFERDAQPPLHAIHQNFSSATLAKHSVKINKLAEHLSLSSVSQQLGVIYTGHILFCCKLAAKQCQQAESL